MVRSLGRHCLIWIRTLGLKRPTLAGAFLDERGKDMVELALVIALICLAVIVGIRGSAGVFGAGSTDTGRGLGAYMF